jgi:hypothetical protein
MSNRPLSITIIGWLFIVVGAIGLVGSAMQLIDAGASGAIDDLKKHGIVWLSRIAAVIAGVFVLYGHNWARWLIVVWMGLHIVLSALHSPLQLLMHLLVFAPVLYFLFYPPAANYFRPSSPERL